MLKPAFSTVACPEWTLRQVATRAIDLGFEAVELRTFGEASRLFACDPALSSEPKVRSMFREEGVDILSLATGLRFDEMVWPPVMGYLLTDHERSIREGKRAVDLAVGLECPFVRVFGFEYPAREKKAAAMKRIAGRLGQLADHADKTGVRVVVENGGSFSTAAALRELIDAVGHPLLGASYSLAPGVKAGDQPISALGILNDRLWIARIKDVSTTGAPVPLGRGNVPAEAFVRSLASAGFDGPLVYEWDRAWIEGLTGPEAALPEASRTIFGWLGASTPGPSSSVRSAALAR